MAKEKRFYQEEPEEEKSQEKKFQEERPGEEEFQEEESRGEGWPAEAIEEVAEKMKDIRNVVQLLEMSLQSNGDDGHIVRSVRVIDKMLASVLEHDMPRLREGLYGCRQGFSRSGS